MPTAVFDPNKPYDVIYGSSKARYMQDGEHFDGQGNRVSPYDAAMPADPNADRMSAGEKAEAEYQRRKELEMEQGQQELERQNANAQIVQTDNVQTVGTQVIGKPKDENAAPDISSLSDEEQVAVNEALENFRKSSTVANAPPESKDVPLEEAGVEAKLEFLRRQPPPVLNMKINEVKDAIDPDELDEDELAELAEYPAEGKGSKELNVQFLMKWAS